MNEPKLVDPVELEVGEDAEAASLSCRTGCSGAFCASKHHQSILSSIQRHSAHSGAIRQPAAALRTSWRAQILCELSAVWRPSHVPRPAPWDGAGAGGRKENVGRRGGTARWLLTFCEEFSSLMSASLSGCNTTSVVSDVHHFHSKFSTSNGSNGANFPRGAAAPHPTLNEESRQRLHIVALSGPRGGT